MTRPAPTREGGAPESAAAENSVGVPIRRSRWVSFWVGVAALFSSLLAAAALAGLLLLLLPPDFLDGAWVIIIFLAVWSGIFFSSLPWQKHYARSRDCRHPGASLAGRRLTIPLAEGGGLSFDLGEPHELTYGWFEIITPGGGGPTSNTRGLVTYAILSQAGQELFLQAEDSVREAQTAGWPNRTNPTTPDLRVRLWACDLVTLVEAARSQAPPTAAPEPTKMPPTDAISPPAGPIREWPENPLPARNRHEVTLFLDWMKVELISRAPAEGGEVCVGRVRGADPAAAPDTYRLVFSLLEPDPEDEHDFGSGVSRIFDPAELMLMLSRMEREGQLGHAGQDARSEVARVLTHRTTREVAAFRRANARAVALIEQLTRFAPAGGEVPEESVRGSAKRTWLRGARERFDASTLEARRQALGESLRLLQLPAGDAAGPEGQAALVRELRARCPAYLDDLARAGFEGEHVLHPLFSHAYHLARFAARALRGGRPEQAQAAFAAWATAEPSPTFFPTRELADAAHELNLEPETAAALVPADQRHAFWSYYNTLLDPDYNPWSY